MVDVDFVSVMVLDGFSVDALDVVRGFPADVVFSVHVLDVVRDFTLVVFEMVNPMELDGLTGAREVEVICLFVEEHGCCPQ